MDEGAPRKRVERPPFSPRRQNQFAEELSGAFCRVVHTRCKTFGRCLGSQGTYGLVRIGVGRDAAEIAFASPFGEMETGPVIITIEHADGSPEQPGRTTDAISTEEPAPNAGAN